MPGVGRGLEEPKEGERQGCLGVGSWSWVVELGLGVRQRRGATRDTEGDEAEHTQTIQDNLKTQDNSTHSPNSIGGDDHFTMTVKRGQEWGIETSFRLRIMDYLPNKFSDSMGCALSHMRNTYICYFFC
jgi:hypothetical protein